MPDLPNKLTVGEMASRSGVRASALRYYEERGLISSGRTTGGRTGDEALAQIAEWWKGMDQLKRFIHPTSPETSRQKAYVRNWAELSGEGR